MKDESIPKEAYEKGRQNEARATDCCQSVIAAIQDAIGCRNDDILRAGSALAGGLAFTSQGTCGALTGAVMVIGQLCGRTRDEFDVDAGREINEVDFVQVAKGWKLAYELFEWFMAEYGSPICKEVKKKALGGSVEYIRPDSPVRYALTNRLGAHELEGCPEVVGTAARWAAEIILREGILQDKSSF